MTKFNLVTYNVSFSQKHMYERIMTILDNILKCHPLIICLQEVTHESFKYIKQHPYFTKFYNIYAPKFMISDIPKTSYGNLIAYFAGNNEVRLVATKSFKLPSTQMFRYLNTIVFKWNSKRYLVATTHLESVFDNNSWSNAYMTKYKQFRYIFGKLNAMAYNHETDYGILMGDFNITPDDEYYDIFQSPNNWNDQFHTTGSDPKSEYTFDYQKNKSVRGKYRGRLDRVYCQDLQASQFRLIGTANMATINEPPSDHFGIFCQIQLKEL